jgi:NAD(P)-dependent dehydrogenase (short-subunit alcohol dehydrogenase family)
MQCLHFIIFLLLLSDTDSLMTKTILITGATDGIGLLTAKLLVQQGHKVLLHGRSEAKLAQAAIEVGGSSETYQADLSRLEDVESLAAEVMEKHDKLDVLINNAGVLKTPVTKASSGRDIRFEVNTIAPYILTHRLLPIIPKHGRIVNVSSAAQAPVDIAALKGQRSLPDMQAYAQSKLAITTWSAAMAEELPNGPLVVSVNPGSLLASKMVKEGFGVPGKDLGIGADILIRAALAKEFSEASGKYFDNDSGAFATPHPAAQDSKQVAAIMAAIAEIAGI